MNGVGLPSLLTSQKSASEEGRGITPHASKAQKRRRFACASPAQPTPKGKPLPLSTPLRDAPTQRLFHMKCYKVTYHTRTGKDSVLNATKNIHEEYECAVSTHGADVPVTVPLLHWN